MLLVVVFDTNVLLAARLSPHGKLAGCLQLASAGTIISISCQQILDEYEEKLIHRFGRSPTEVRTAVNHVRGFSRVVAITGLLKVVPNDPDDDMIIECALVGGASHIVTGDKRHLLPLNGYRGLTILSPADFLDLAAPQ